MEEQQETQGPKSAEKLIEEYSKYFRFYESAPTIVTVIMSVGCFIVFLAASFENDLFPFAILGVFVCLATYFALKIACSYKILHIAYLKKIEENTRKKEEE